ncbi:unnamed protein product [Durusdinium trenchii]|uniref:Uncharacterized protein n=2 Tax=Durusdinium trenchii TaxID=1381693 RepID=A0ABP0NBK9_9DINO
MSIRRLTGLTALVALSSSSAEDVVASCIADFEVADELMLLQGKVHLHSMEVDSEGDRAVLEMERQRFGKSSHSAEDIDIGAATGVGVLEEQHAHYLVNELREPQMPQLWELWKKRFQSFSHEPWVLALKEKTLRFGRRAALLAVEAGHSTAQTLASTPQRALQWIHSTVPTPRAPDPA